MLYSIYRKLNMFMRVCRDNKIDIYAACASFYIFLSFIPFLVVLLSAIPLLPFSQLDFEAAIVKIVPNEYKSIIMFITSDLYEHNTGTFSLSIIATVWASSRGVLGIKRGLNTINKIAEVKNVLVMRVISMVYTLALAVVMFLMMFLSVFGNRILNFMGRILTLPEWVRGIHSVKDVLTLTVIIILILFVFVTLPDKKPAIRTQFPGAILAAIVWWIFSKIFEYYVSTYDSYSIYGSFAFVIVAGIWLYTGIYIVFIGATFNRTLALRKGIDNEG